MNAKTSVLRHEFTGNAIPRDAFRKDMQGAVIAFMGFDNGFLMLLNEIVKNIWDHADGKGVLILTKRDGGLEFEIYDFGTESFDLEEIQRRGTSKPDTGVNFGAGICGGMIRDMAADLHIDLKLDTSQGFRYTGFYKRKPVRQPKK